jgi:hypothetical protein
MEPYNQDITSTQAQPEQPKERNRKGRIIGGLIIVIVGLVYLANETGVHIPRWVISIETGLIALGLYLGFRHNFKGLGWLIPIVIGCVLLVDDIYPYTDLSDYLWPLIVIGIGLFMIFKPSRKGNDPYWKKKWDADHTYLNTEDDYIDSTVIFGGVKKNIISKNFRGGEAVTVFGGTEINLTQADVDGKIVLDLTQIFGGTKLIVPPHWKIQSEDLVAIFGGVEDKRAILSDPSSVSGSKVLVLKGTCIFGGIDIKSF